MKTCLLGGNFALDTIVTRDYPNGFVIGKSNKFTETIVAETVGNTCGNVACMLAYLGVQSFPIAHLDLSEQGLKIKEDLQQYGADVRFVENSESGGTTLLRCTHKRDKTTGEHTVSFRATSPGSRFPKRRFLRVRDEAPVFMESLDFTPDVFFFDAAEAGLRYLAGELRKRGTLVYFEPESDTDKNKFLKAVEVSDIVKFSHEKVGDTSFTAQYKDKLFIRTLGAEGLEFNLCGQGWVKVASVPNDNVVDWEGAGDWTTSQFIAGLCERDILSISQMTTDSVIECLEIACEIASQSVSFLGSKGMIDMYNELDEIASQLETTYKFEIKDGVAIIPDGTTEIPLTAFRECQSLRSVTIPKSVITIRENAFVHCHSLENIVIQNGVKEIEGGAFSSCISLKSITIPESVTDVGYNIFCGCFALESISGKFATEDHRALVVDGELTAVASGGLTDYTIPDGVTTICYSAFFACKSLRSVTIPESVKEIGEFAFYGCPALEKITIPDGIIKIQDSTFMQCTALQSISLPESIKEIGDRVFAECESLKTITIPERVEKIGGYAFYGCKSLTSIIIPKSVSEIHMRAFEGCTSLESVTLLSRAKLGHGVFRECPSLKTINIPSDYVDYYKEVLPEEFKQLVVGFINDENS